MQMDEQSYAKIDGIARGPVPGHRPRRRGHSAGPDHRTFRAGISGKTTLALHVSPLPRKPAAWPRSSTPNTPWTPPGPRSSAWISAAAGQPARHRRAGPGNRRDARLLERGGLIVIDSVAALIPKAELEGEMGDSHIGLQARLMSQAMRKLTGVISKSKCA